MGSADVSSAVLGVSPKTLFVKLVNLSLVGLIYA